ncbi:MAG: hypothetical protein HY770_04490 [Chitinivibrionia bacterium]|nr:hypothetical protein [Chitinivibrionia bacterium]
MKPRVAVITAMVCIVFLNSSAFCSESGTASNEHVRTRWGIMRLQGVFIEPLGDNRVEAWNDCGDGWLDYLSFSGSIKINTTGGVVASFEYVLARKYGIEAGFAYWPTIVDLHFEASGVTVDGSPNFIMPTIGMNYHFLTDEKKDLYAGGLCCLGVIATGFASDIEVSKDVALGLNAGIDYYVKNSWSLGACLKYIDFGELDFSLLPPGLEGIVCDNGLFGIGHMNTISFTLGAGYRF